MKDLLYKALSYYGLEEITTATEHNPQILAFFGEIGHQWVQTDETAWCSAFINYCAKLAGYPYSGRLDARSWLNVGDKIDLPEIGCVTVLWRESPQSWKGHVGLFINQDHRYVYLLGGNQDNRVCIKRYPKNRILEFRKLNKTGYGMD